MTFIRPILESVLRAVLSHRKMHEGGYDKGIQKWTDSQNRGQEWQEANVWIEHNEPFWVNI